MKHRTIPTHSMAALALLAALAATSHAATFPFLTGFEDSPVGDSAPVGWRHGPPSGTRSIGEPWSVAEVEGWGRVYQFSGPDELDGVGRAYATIPIDGVPHGDGANWRFSVEFQLAEFLMDGPMDSFRFGLGVLGQNALFASASAGGFGGNDFYLIDWGFTLPEEIRQLDRVSMTYRFIEFGALGAVDIGFFSQHIPAGFFNTQDTFRMIVEGRYTGATLTLTSWVENRSGGGATNPVSAVASNPLPGRHFGFRFQSGAGVTTISPPSPNNLGALTIYLDNVRLTDVNYVDPEPPPPFWDSFADAGDGWKDGWIGRLRPAAGPWAFHPDLGWLYSISPGPDFAWILPAQNPALGWAWTAEDVFPFMWTQLLGWCYLLGMPDLPPYLNVLETGQWIGLAPMD